MREAIGAPVPPYLRATYEVTVDRLRVTLGEDRFDAGWAEGRAMSVTDAIDHALSIEIEPSETEGAAPSAPAAAVTPAATPRERSPLSAREEEVAALVAGGLTNRQIAAELVIAERTAGSHVAHILDKLGFTTRAQIAAWAVERGLAGPGRA
jgi:non-specific serine/threonine protein kinase